MSESQEQSMQGKVAIVTGPTGGIGLEVARGLAQRGATLILAARSVPKGEATRAELSAQTKNLSITVMELDVSSQRSIRTFSSAFAQRHAKLDLLVNNAGAWFSDRKTSPDGHELTLATNVIGPYLLTKLLDKPLRAASPSRVVNVVSSFASNYDASDLEFSRRGFDGFKAYGQSKQALRMITWGLASRLKGSGVTANAAAPGFVRTDFNRNAHGFVAAMIGLSAKLFAVSPAKGAETPLWVATAAELGGVTGKYFEAHKEKDGKFREEAPIAELERALDRMIAPGAAKVGSSEAMLS